MTSGVSIWRWIVVGAVMLLLFVRGELKRLFGEAAVGVRAFRSGDLREVELRMKEQEEQEEHDRRLARREWRLQLVIGGLAALLLVELAQRFSRF